MSTASSGLSITTIDLTPWRGARNIGNIRFAHRSKTLVTVFRVLNFARLLGLCWALHHTGTSRSCFLEISQPIFLATFVTKSSREHECWVEKICMEAGLKQKNCCQWVSFQVHHIDSKFKNEGVIFDNFRNWHITIFNLCGLTCVYMTNDGHVHVLMSYLSYH